jgi:predicted glycosyltransferase
VAGADVVVSAGGSMNREAAALGTPAHSIYAGKLAAVDRALVAAGSMSLVHDQDDIARLPLGRKAVTALPQLGDALVVQFVDRLLALARP